MEQSKRRRAERTGVMIAIRTTVRMLAARRQAPALRADIADLLHNLAKALFDPYRPELHYMRGPGPKWHAKHDPAPAAAVAVRALVRGHASGARRPSRCPPPVAQYLAGPATRDPLRPAVYPYA